MKRLNEKELDNYIKRALEKTEEVKPKVVNETQWKKIKIAEKRKKRARLFRQIPVYASSFIALFAVVYLFSEVPETSDKVVFENEQRLATIDRAYEEIQQVTMLKEASLYPTYLPENTTLVKEEWAGQNRVLYYEGTQHMFVIDLIYEAETSGVGERKTAENVLERKWNDMTLVISGDAPKELLLKVIESIQ